MAERITYITTDSVKIVGDWVTAPTTVGAVILLHTMQTTRSVWASLQAALAKRGLASLAIDLRGHGESVEGPEASRVDFKQFSDEEHQSSINDVIGAYEWLRKRGFERPQIALAGGSIGANLAIQFLLEEPQVRGAVLLSPGKDYQGISALADIGSVLPGQALWVSASEGDDQGSFEIAHQVYETAVSERKAWVPQKNAGHATAMLTSHPELLDAISDWLRGIITTGI